MLKNKTRVKGKITAIVFDKDGNIKRFKPSFIRRILGLPGRPMYVVNHNIVTDEGDALIADLMSNSPARAKVDGTNGHIQVGTGFITESKSATGCNTPTGNPEQMDTGYPQLKDSWGNANDNVVVYRSTFEAGDLNANGINEAALLNNSVPANADCLAYAQISPSVNVTSQDTLQITWELTITGV